MLKFERRVPNGENVRAIGTAESPGLNCNLNYLHTTFCIPSSLRPMISRVMIFTHMNVRVATMGMPEARNPSIGKKALTMGTGRLESKCQCPQGTIQSKDTTWLCLEKQLEGRAALQVAARTRRSHLTSSSFKFSGPRSDSSGLLT